MHIDGPRASTSLAAAGLGRQGYTEVEHVIRGNADLFGYDDEGATVRVDSGVPSPPGCS